MDQQRSSNQDPVDVRNPDSFSTSSCSSNNATAELASKGTPGTSARVPLHSGPLAAPSSTDALAPGRQQDGPVRGLADGGQHGQLRDTIFPSTSQAYRPLEFEPYLPETANADNSELVFLRFELIQDEPVINRVVWSVLWISTLISIGLLVTFGVIEKYIHLWDSGFPICNVVLGGALLTGCSACLASVGFGIVCSWGKEYTSIRRELVITHFLLLAFQTIQLVMYIIPNAYILGFRCNWFRAVVLWCWFVRSTMFAAIFAVWLGIARTQLSHAIEKCQRVGVDLDLSPAAAFMHSYRHCYVIEAAVFLGVTLCVLFFSIDWLVWMAHPTAAQLCLLEFADRKGPGCRYSTAGYILRSFSLGILCLTFFLTSAFLTYTLRAMRFMPYQTTRVSQVLVRLLFWVTTLLFTTFIASLFLANFLDTGHCAGYLYSILGFPPSEVLLSVFTCVGALMSTPVRPREGRLQRIALLRRFAWLERDYQRVACQRRSPCGKVDLTRDPLFCMETALKLLKFSTMTYVRLADSQISRDTLDVFVKQAFKDYDLEQYGIFDEEHYKSRAIIAHGTASRTILVAFRGTSNIRNLHLDLRGWPTIWPWHRGLTSVRQLALMHAGFMQGYTHDGWNKKLLDHVCSLLNAWPRWRAKVLVTGHSLGAAYACLFTDELTWRCREGLSRDDVVTYTFGAPAVATAAFERCVTRHCRDLWAVQNKHDPVVYRSKLMLYNWVGHKAVISRWGDLILRPGFWDHTFVNWLGAERVADHSLSMGYRKAFAAIIADAASTGQISTSVKRMLDSHLRFMKEFGAAVGWNEPE